MAIITEIRRKLPLLPSKDTDQAKNTTDAPSATIHEICIDDIIPNRNQPRSAFNQNAILRLSDSIKRYGILQPLTVRKVMLPLTANNRTSSHSTNTVIYELVAGERRLRAAKLAGLGTVPCIIINTDDATSAELAIIENLLRENLNMFEQAEAFQRLISEFHLTQEEAARRVSMSQSAVANKLRILRLLPEEREKILEAGLTERHARALLKLNDPNLRQEALQHILERRLNVSATETYIDRIVCELSRQAYRSKSENNLQNHDDSSALAPRSNPLWLKNEKSVVDESQELPAAIRNVMQHRRRFKGAIKDMQLFYNSIQNALQILESAGVYGQMSKNEQEDHVVLTITLSKNALDTKI